MISEIMNLVEANKTNIEQMHNDFVLELKREIKRDKESEEKMQEELSALKHQISLLGDKEIDIS